ncbi:hypothetical protein V6N13_130259 [Hibiscus sabdariffa]
MSILLSGWKGHFPRKNSRAPGLDEFNVSFLKCYWVHLKAEILRFFKESYSGKFEDSSINCSFVVLIPEPVSNGCFSANQLCGLCAKVLSKRLSGLLGNLISGRQFVFCPLLQMK